MHRSGTSAVAGCLCQTGLFDVGKSEMPPSFDNPRGFYENTKIVEFNDYLLDLLNLEWSDLVSMEGKFSGDFDFEELFLNLDSIIADEFTSDSIVLIKDPRLSLVFPFWEEYAKSRSIDLRVLEVIRDPDEVASSLGIRNSFSAEKSFRLWCHYLLSFETYKRSSEVVLCSFDHILADPEPTVAAICEHLLDLKLDNDFLKDCLSGFLGKKRELPDKLEIAHPIADASRKLYDSLIEFKTEPCLKKTAEADHIAVEFFESHKADIYPYSESRIRVLVDEGTSRKQYTFPLNTGKCLVSLPEEQIENAKEIRLYPANRFSHFEILSCVGILEDGTRQDIELDFDKIIRVEKQCFSTYENASFSFRKANSGFVLVEIQIHYYSADLSSIRSLSKALLGNLASLQSKLAGSPGVDDYSDSLNSLESKFGNHFELLHALLSDEKEDLHSHLEQVVSLLNKKADILKRIEEGVQEFSDPILEKVNQTTVSIGELINSLRIDFNGIQVSITDQLESSISNVADLVERLALRQDGDSDFLSKIQSDIGSILSSVGQVRSDVSSVKKSQDVIQNEKLKAYFDDFDARIKAKMIEKEAFSVMQVNLTKLLSELNEARSVFNKCECDNVLIKNQIIAMQKEIVDQGITLRKASMELSEVNRKNSTLDSSLDSMQRSFSSMQEESARMEEAFLREKTEAIIQLEGEVQKMEGSIAEKDHMLSESHKHLDQLKTDLRDRNWEVGQLKIEIDSIKKSISWRVGRAFVIPIAILMVPFIWLQKFKPIQDIQLGLKLFKREGSREFLRRTFWYLRGRRLLEEIPIKKAVEGNSTGETLFESLQEPIDYSIIIPVYNQWDFTEKCLASIANNTNADLRYEVILANDSSTDETKTRASRIGGLRIVTPSKNLGFLKNCNYAADHARGRKILFLNNDTEVCDGWLNAIDQAFESDNKIGVVGSKLVFPNGRLQEAGGIIFKDGSGWNYGRGSDPEASEFNYIKDVDYCSGAALSIKKELWTQLGGFDEHFCPAYYEDTDLCFSARRAGFRTVYQPKSVVVHYEGGSHGVELDSGIKQNQLVNQKKFVQKWKDVLSLEHPENGQQIFHARDRSSSKKTILFIDHYVPFYDKDAGSRSTFHWVKVFLNLGYNIKFLGDNYFRHEPYTSDLQFLGVEVLYGTDYQKNWKKWIKENSESLDVVFFHRPHITLKYIDFVLQNTNAYTMYQPHDLHFLRLRRKWEIDQDDESLKQSTNWFEKEKYIAENVDRCLTFSDFELEVIRKEFNCKSSSVVPLFAYDSIDTTRLRVEGRSGLLFVGGYGHPPNMDALNWFLENVFPFVLEAHPDIVLHLVGSNMPDDLKKKSGRNIKIYGFVSDEELELIYQSVRIVIIPLRYGAGVKGKLIESMRYGVPVVGTSIATEGVPGISSIVPSTDTAVAFRERICDLLGDNNVWEEHSKNSLKFIDEFFTQEAAAEVARQIVP